MRSRQARAGYTLIEILTVLVVSGLVLSALFYALIGFMRGLQPQSVSVGGEVLPVAPTFGAFPSALRVNEQLGVREADARAIYVLGGRHVSIPANAPQTAVKPLAIMALPVISDFSAGLPMDAKTFYDTYAGFLGGQESSSSSEDFSIVVIGPSNGALAVTMLVQVRRIDRSVSDGVETTPYIERDVRAWDIDEGALRYAFLEHPASASKTFVGAVHTWMRYQVNAVAEEGPTCVVLPDPWIYAGARGYSDDIPPFSRFSYFLAVSR